MLPVGGVQERFNVKNWCRWVIITSISRRRIVGGGGGSSSSGGSGSTSSSSTRCPQRVNPYRHRSTTTAAPTINTTESAVVRTFFFLSCSCVMRTCLFCLHDARHTDDTHDGEESIQVINQSIDRSNASIYRPINQFITQSLNQPTHPSVHPSTHQFIHVPIRPSIHPCNYQSIHQCIHPSPSAKLY